MAASVLEPVFYLKAKNHFSNDRLMKFCYIVAGISGLLVLIPGQLSAWTFLFSFLPFTTVARPFGMDVLLSRAKENIGTAASMINFVPNLFGSLGMALGTLPWGNFINGVGIIILASTILSLIMFKFVGKI